MLKIENCKERQRRLLREMESKGVGLAVLANPKTVYYFSGALVDPSKPQVFALSASGKSLLVTNQEPSQAAAERVAVYTAYTIERIFNHATMSAEAAALLGVLGAAIGTTIGRTTGVLLGARQLTRGSGHIAVRRDHARVEARAVLRLARMCASGTFQILIGSAAWIGLIRILATFGSVAVAGYTIAIRIVVFAILPAWGLSNAAATMVGQALGARNPDRAERSVWTAARYNLVFLGGVGVLFVAFAPLIISAFTTDREVAAVAALGLRVIAIGFPCFAFGMVLTQSFNGAGDTWTPTWINLGIYWAFEIPLAWWLAHMNGLAYRGVFVAITVGYAALASVSAIFFRRGDWKKRHVLGQSRRSSSA